MKKNNNKFSFNNEFVNSFINKSSYKKNNFTSNTNSFYLSPSSERNEASNRGKKILSQQEINNWQKKYIKINLSSNKKNRINNNLLYINYVKPLKFALKLKNNIDSFNTLETERNDKTDSKILNQKKYFQPIMNNNYFK